jgi:hypothetical protein
MFIYARFYSSLLPLLNVLGASISNLSMKDKHNQKSTTIALLKIKYVELLKFLYNKSSFNAVF